MHPACPPPLTPHRSRLCSTPALGHCKACVLVGCMQRCAQAEQGCLLCMRSGSSCERTVAQEPVPKVLEQACGVSCCILCVSIRGTDSLQPRCRHWDAELPLRSRLTGQRARVWFLTSPIKPGRTVRGQGSRRRDASAGDVRTWKCTSVGGQCQLADAVHHCAEALARSLPSQTKSNQVSWT